MRVLIDNKIFYLEGDLNDNGLLYRFISYKYCSLEVLDCLILYGETYKRNIRLI